MCLKKIFDKKNRTAKKVEIIQPELNRERIAQHEAAHGIVWYLFKNNWVVNSLTIERNGLPDERMNGALQISPNFDVNGQNSIERANELFAIAFAGMIGQNMNLLIHREYICIEIAQVTHFNRILDTTGCSGDFEIAFTYLAPLAHEFNVNQYLFAKYKVMDLVYLFQNNYRVEQLHSQLTQTLLEKGTLKKEELEHFFEEHNFQEYVEDENLDINFFHQR